MILEPLSHAMEGADVDSTGDMLSKVEEFNHGKKYPNQMNDKVAQEETDRTQAPTPNHAEPCNMFKFVCERPSGNPVQHTKCRVEVVRNIKSRKDGMPNLQAKLQATRLLDDVDGGEAIRLPN